jgi:hypothetical protein
VEGWPLHGQWISRAGGRYAAIMLGLRLSDLTGGFKCFRASALRRLDPDLVRSRGHAFQIELTYHAARAGLEIVEIPIVFHERELGRSKMSAGIALEAMWRVPSCAWLPQRRARPDHSQSGPMTAHLTSWIADLGLAGIFALMTVDAVLPAGGRPFVDRHGRWLHLGPRRVRRRSAGSPVTARRSWCSAA